MIKAITIYGDQYGNPCDGRVIISGKVKQTKYGADFEVSHPLSFKNRVSTITDYKTLPENNTEKVGYYSSKSHYEISKKYGLTKGLDKSTVDGFEEMTRQDDKNIFTWYSYGLKIHESLGEEQTELY